jgi:hypothetical protein
MAKGTGSKPSSNFKYSKEQIMKVAEQKFGLNRTEAIATFFDAPEEMTVEEAEAFVKKFKERTVQAWPDGINREN